MKKVLFIIVCTMGMVSCGPRQPEETSNVVGEIDGYSIVLIDSCEYLEYKRGMGKSRVYSLTHKGNCKNH